MTMIVANDHFETSHAAGFRFAFTVMATALVTLIGVPALALLVSYVAGGSATSTILAVYLFAILTNGPFLLAAVAILTGLVAMPRLISSVAHHQHA